MTSDANDERRWPVFEAEVLPHLERLFRLAMWFERDRAEAEDLVQETLHQALESFHRFAPGTNCRAWLVSILQHLRSNRRRARGRSPLVEDVDGAVAEATAVVPPVPEQVTDEDMLAALARVPPVFQEVLLLADVEELSYKEISQALSIPIGTVMSRINRGRAKLRSQLAGTAGPSERRRDAASGGTP